MPASQARQTVKRPPSRVPQTEIRRRAEADKQGGDTRAHSRMLDALRSVKGADGTVRLSHGQRGAITHSLRIAAERFRDNAKAVRHEIDRYLETNGLATPRLINLQDLAEQMERQARDAADAADLFEDCSNVEVALSECQLEPADPDPDAGPTVDVTHRNGGGR